MTGTGPANGKRQHRIERLSKRFANRQFRQHYFARQLKIFLAAQIRALRGDRSQTEFGHLIGKPQSVVSRLERESYGKVNLQTLIDVATSLDIALVVRFVRFDTFLNWTNDYSVDALAPESYSKMVSGIQHAENPRGYGAEQTISGTAAAFAALGMGQRASSGIYDAASNQNIAQTRISEPHARTEIPPASAAIIAASFQSRPMAAYGKRIA